MSSVEKEAVAEDGDALASVEAKRACLPATSTGSDSTFIGQCVSGYALAYPLLLVKHKHIPQHPMLALSFLPFSTHLFSMLQVTFEKGCMTIFFAEAALEVAL